MQLECKLLDFQTFPVQGKLMLEGQNLLFHPDVTENQAAELSINRQDVRAITNSDIGYRSEKGPYVEFTFYMKDVQRIYTFSELLKSMNEQIANHLIQNFEITPVQRDIDVAGWNWGSVKISQHSLTFQPVLEEDDVAATQEDGSLSASADKGQPKSDAGSASEGSDDIEDVEVFHVPLSQIAEFQKIDKRDLLVELLPSTDRQAVYIKSLTFLMRDEAMRNDCYNYLSAYSQNAQSSRIVLFENIQVCQPAGKYILEFQQNQMRLIGSKDYSRGQRDVVRIILLERPQKGYEKQYYVVLQFASGKKIENHDFVAFETSNRNETKEVFLGEAEERLKEHLKVNNFGALKSGSLQHSKFGQDSLLVEQIEYNRTAVHLREVPQFIIVMKMLSYVFSAAMIVFSPYTKRDFQLGMGENQLENVIQFDENSDSEQDEQRGCYIQCRYKQKSTKEMFAYFLQKFIILLPQDIKLINYQEIYKIEVKTDTKNSHGNYTYAIIEITLRGGQDFVELSKVDSNKVKGIISFIKGRNVQNLQVINKYSEIGGRAGQEMLPTDDDTEDSNFNEGDDGVGESHSADSYEDSGVTSESEQEQNTLKVDKKQPKEDKKNAKQKRDGLIQQIEEIDNVRPEDALEDLGMTTQWANFTAGSEGDSAVSVESESG